MPFSVACSNWAIIADEAAMSCLDPALLGNQWVSPEELQTMVSIVTFVAVHYSPGGREQKVAADGETERKAE